MSMRPRRGVSLLEVLVALVVIATSGLATIALARSGVALVEHASAEELEVTYASDLLDAAALWPSAELDRRLGTREQGRMRLVVERHSSVLYDLVVLDSTASRVLLRTSVYRPASERLDAR